MEKKKVSITIRIDPTEKMRIKHCADLAAQSVTEYIIEAVRERLVCDEVPADERSDIEHMKSTIPREAPLEVSDKPSPELDKKSISELIKDYVDGDDTVT